MPNGTYDLIKEFKEYYGNSFFDNFKGGEGEPRGIYVGGGTHLIFSPNSEVTFNYPSSGNKYIHSLFSPFNSYPGGFIIENMNLKCSNCRYCIHDERGYATDVYYNTYKNLNLYIDNRNNPDWASKTCIGGGLGKNGVIEIRDSIFESEGATGDIVAYHNSLLADAKSRITITGCYFKNATTIRISWYGNSTLITEAVISNNSLGAEIISRRETPDSTNVNTKIIEFNNTVRT